MQRVLFGIGAFVAGRDAWAQPAAPPPTPAPVSPGAPVPPDAPASTSTPAVESAPVVASTPAAVTTSAADAPATSPPAAVAQDASVADSGASHHGVFVLGGLGLGTDYHWPRVDLLYPLPMPKAPRLRAGVILTYSHAQAEIPELAVEAYGFGFYPTATYDWPLPIRSSAGRFVIGVDGSLGAGIARVKIDEPFMPGNFETIWVLTMRIAGRAEFRANAGWVAAFQFLGFDVPLTDPDQPMNGVVTTDVAVELAFLGGYQF